MMTFKDLLGTISSMAVEAQHAMTEQSAARLNDLFYEEEGVLKPKSVCIDTGESQINITLAQLRNLNSMRAKDMSMEIETDLILSGSNKDNDDDEDDMDNVSTSLKPGARKNQAHIKLTVNFEAIPPPEGVARLMDELNNQTSSELIENVVISENDDVQPETTETTTENTKETEV